MTRRTIDDPDRPLCPTCGKPMRRNGIGRDGQRQWDCWRCRETRPRCETCGRVMCRNGHGKGGEQHWDCYYCRNHDGDEETRGDIALPLPAHLQAPVVRCPIGGCIEVRSRRRCVYWEQCAQNSMLDLPVLGERTATILIGHTAVTV